MYAGPVVLGVEMKPVKPQVGGEAARGTGGHGVRAGPCTDGKPQDSYLAACRRVLLETVGVGLYLAMRPRRRAHGMSLLFMLLVWFVIQQCARVTWLLSIGLGCLSFAIHHPEHLVLKIGLYIMRERAPASRRSCSSWRTA